MTDLNKLFGMATGTEENDLEDYKRYYLSDMVEGQSFSGEATIELFPIVERDDEIKKYSQIRFRLIDEHKEPKMNEDDNVEVGEYLDIYLNCPKFKDNGIATRIQKPTERFDFHRNLWNFLTGIMGIVDPKSLIDPKTGDEINIFKKINLKNVAEFVEGKRVTVEQVEVPDSNYPTFKITSIQ
ncbi:hypothetical protein [uncultured Methanobrevibacter sp.]|uniref:hypothetical protein n=1 Tax=uncultured Methanobrevibacter sp. TaxID=253161 RepID=UPI0025F4384C|nr:hypothetical protein [uncultured Methanobrevibacter sp.]